MIAGVVTSSREAIVRLVMRGASGQEEEIEPDKALGRMVISLRSIAAGQLGR